MQHLRAVVEIDDAERGLVRQPGPIVTMFETPAVLGRGAPALDSDGPVAAVGAVGTLGRRRDGRPRREWRDDPSAALSDVTVLELGTFFAAPFGGTVLREVGARVIKVEPMGGEPMRIPPAVS